VNKSYVKRSWCFTASQIHAYRQARNQKLFFRGVRHNQFVLSSRYLSLRGGGGIDPPIPLLVASLLTESVNSIDLQDKPFSCPDPVCPVDRKKYKDIALLKKRRGPFYISNRQKHVCIYMIGRQTNASLNSFDVKIKIIQDNPDCPAGRYKRDFSGLGTVPQDSI